MIGRLLLEGVITAFVWEFACLWVARYMGVMLWKGVLGPSPNRDSNMIIPACVFVPMSSHHPIGSL